AAVVASLNSGLSMRNLDDGIVRSQQTRAGTAELWETRSGVSRVVSSPGIRLQSEPSRSPRPSSEPSGRNSDRHLPRPATPIPDVAETIGSPPQVSSSPSAPVDLKQRSGAATLAWVLFVLLLLGGGAVLAYTMLVAEDSNVPAGSNATEPAPPAPTAQKAEPPEKHATPTHGSQHSAPTSVVHVPPAHSVATAPTAEDNSPKGLIAQSAADEAARDWPTVRAV